MNSSVCQCILCEAMSLDSIRQQSQTQHQMYNRMAEKETIKVFEWPSQCPGLKVVLQAIT